jgi:hypothetical protein
MQLVTHEDLCSHREKTVLKTVVKRGQYKNSPYRWKHMSEFECNIRNMNTAIGATAYFETAQRTHSIVSFLCSFLTLLGSEWDKYVQNFFTQQNRFASTTDNTTKPIYSSGFIYKLKAVQHKSLEIQGTSVNIEKKITHNIGGAQIPGTWLITFCTVAPNIFSIIEFSPYT